MAPPKDIARSYPKRGLTADVGFRSEPKFCGDGSTSLNGTSDYLESTLTTALGSGFSVSLWFLKRTTTGSNNYLWSSGSSGGGSFISLSCTSTNALAMYDQASFLTSSLTANLNQWHHAVVTVGTGANSYTVYLDGIGESLANTASPNITNGDFEIGRYSLGSTHYHDGLVSDVRIYDQVLTQDQVREIYNNPGLTIPTGLSASNLRHRYKLETDYVDTGASGDDLTAFGSPSFTVNRPQLPRGLDLARGAAQARVYTGRAVDFDGGADGLASTATLNINTSGAKATLACWVNPDVSTAGNKTIVSNAIDTNNNQFTIYQNGTSYAVSAVYASGFTKVNYFADSQVKAGAWTFLCAVWDFDTTSLTFYVDGASFTDTPSTAIGSTNGVFEIGCRDPSGSKSQLFDGQIASIKLFDTTLTQAQVRELYHNPEQVLPTGVSASNLRRYYPLSDYNDTGGTGGRYFQDMGADGEPAEDKGSCSMAFAQPVPCPQLGLQQSATRLYYDGTSGTTYNVEVTGHSLNLPSFSIAFWGFFQSNNPNTTSCCFDTSGGGTFQYFINSTAGNLTVYNGAPTATFNGAVPRDEWVHVVITGHDSSPYIKCYVNGAEKTINSGSAATVGLVATNYYLFSRSANTLSHTGFGDNYSIYDSNLGASEALELYNQGIGYDPRTNVGNYTSASSLIRLYKFDDLTTVKDYSGNNAHADVNGTFKAASFPENASGSTIVGDFSMKRKGVSILNLTGADDGTAIIPAQESVYPKAGAANGYTVGFCYRKIKDGTAMVWGNFGASLNDQFMCFQQTGPNLRFNLGDGSSRPAVNTSTITDSDWHHYTLTISYATTPAAVKIYVDGAVDHSSTQSITGPPALHPMHLGTGLFNGQGPVGCFKFYQVALSADEVKRLAFSDLRLIKGLANE